MSVRERIDCSDCMCQIDAKVETLLRTNQIRGCRQNQRRDLKIEDKDGETLRTRRGCCEGSLVVVYEPSEEDITTNRTTISPRTGAKQDTTQYETTQRAVRQTTTLGNTQKAGDKPLTWEPENYNQTFTQSNPQTVSPTQVFREMPLKSNHATVIVPTLATVSAIAILLLLVICFIVYKRYIKKSQSERRKAFDNKIYSVDHSSDAILRSTESDYYSNTEDDRMPKYETLQPVNTHCNAKVQEVSSTTKSPLYENTPTLKVDKQESVCVYENDPECKENQHLFTTDDNRNKEEFSESEENRNHHQNSSSSQRISINGKDLRKFDENSKDYVYDLLNSDQQSGVSDTGIGLYNHLQDFSTDYDMFHTNKQKSLILQSTNCVKQLP